MSQFLLWTSLLAGAWAPLPKSAKPLPAPKSPTPTLGYVVSVQKDKTLIMQSTVSVPVTVHELVTKVAQGRKITEAVPVTKYRSVAQRTAHKLDGVRFLDREGKELPLEKVKKRIPGRPVLVLRNPPEGKLDPTWASILDKDAIVIVFPK